MACEEAGIALVAYHRRGRLSGAWLTQPRAVGGFLSQHGAGLPWWRVVRADGHLADHKVREQSRRLRAEGVEVVAGRVVEALPR